MLVAIILSGTAFFINIRRICQHFIDLSKFVNDRIGTILHWIGSHLHLINFVFRNENVARTEASRF